MTKPYACKKGIGQGKLCSRSFSTVTALYEHQQEKHAGVDLLDRKDADACSEMY